MTQASRYILVPDDQPHRYAAQLADQHKDELGFLPRTIYEPMWHAGRLYTAEENGEPCGFILRGPYKKTVRIYQTCIVDELRWMEHGRNLVQRIIREAIETDVHQISLWCAADLAANQFWNACDFDLAAQNVLRRNKDRPHHRWQMDLPDGTAHRARLAADPVEARRNKIMDVMSLWTGNAPAIKRQQAKRQE